MPLDQRGKSRKLVGLGGYLVNALGNCWDCHADPALRPQAKLQVTTSEEDEQPSAVKSRVSVVHTDGESHESQLAGVQAPSRTN